MSFNADKLNILYETPVEYLPRISAELDEKMALIHAKVTTKGRGDL